MAVSSGEHGELALQVAEHARRERRGERTRGHQGDPLAAEGSGNVPVVCEAPRTTSAARV
ncbi:hypothetical protein [Streptomyces sp. CB01881]|uniref:hypothetical protein n=1 Tax=Streptomyces sp. CB01881 TaxID=2078691 RepID=UPI000CDBC554|nr:hypothetical protein [Streptomyces sp. CB01881]AUY53666.1 hypothetical protein C2142_38020 [Streptomyces sp. CB01881]TYC68680.1 hypothetical protein EH183_38020 [Streptomyces sp. CB01881]